MAMNVLPGPGSGGAECLAANLMPALGQERVEARVLGLLDPPFGADLGETLVQDGISAWHPGNRQAFDPQTFVRLARVLDRVGSQGGPAISLHLPGLTQRTPSLDKPEGAQ